MKSTLLVFALLIAGCTTEVDSPNMGTVETNLQIGPSVTINTVNWTISNATSGFMRSGTVNVKFSNTLANRVSSIEQVSVEVSPAGRER